MGLASAQQAFLRTRRDPTGQINHADPSVPPLPEGWTEELDPATGVHFYTNDELGERSWVRPNFRPPPGPGMMGGMMGGEFTIAVSCTLHYMCPILIWCLWCISLNNLLLSFYLYCRWTSATLQRTPTTSNGGTVSRHCLQYTSAGLQLSPLHVYSSSFFCLDECIMYLQTTTISTSTNGWASTTWYGGTAATNGGTTVSNNSFSLNVHDMFICFHCQLIFYLPVW